MRSKYLQMKRVNDIPVLQQRKQSMDYKKWESILLSELKLYMSIVPDLSKEHDSDGNNKIYRLIRIFRQHNCL